MTSLIDQNQRGGAYIRDLSLVKTLEQWGHSVSSLYQKDILTKRSLKQWMLRFKFGPQVQSLFNKANITIEHSDILILDHFRQLQWRFRDPLGPINKSRTKVIYNAHNLEFENYFGKGVSQEREKFALYEAKMMERADYIFLCSDREKELLLTLNPALEGRLFVFPNLVESENYESFDEKADLITFTGTLDYFPNIEAVEFITQNLIPKLPKDLVSKIVVAGRRPAEKVVQLCQENGIDLRVDLSDGEMKNLFAQSKISLVPLISGSGTRLKIIEALFSRSIVLTTPMGSEGVEHDCMVRCTLDDFADQLIDLYSHRKFEDICSEDELLAVKNDFDRKTWATRNRLHFFMFSNTH